MNKYLFSIVCIFVIGCASPQILSKKIELNQVRSLASSAADQTGVEALFGKPSMEVDLKSGDKGWIYLQKNSPRLSVVFKGHSKDVKELNWFVDEHEAESDLATAQKIFVKSDFKKIKPEWGTSHFGPSYVLYLDSKDNIKLVYQINSSKISQISWEISDTAPRAPTEAK